MAVLISNLSCLPSPWSNLLAHDSVSTVAVDTCEMAFPSARMFPATDAGNTQILHKKQASQPKTSSWHLSSCSIVSTGQHKSPFSPSSFHLQNFLSAGYRLSEFSIKVLSEHRTLTTSWAYRISQTKLNWQECYHEFSCPNVFSRLHQTDQLDKWRERESFFNP